MTSIDVRSALIVIRIADLRGSPPQPDVFRLMSAASKLPAGAS
jgi:hypothetical protein